MINTESLFLYNDRKLKVYVLSKCEKAILPILKSWFMMALTLARRSASTSLNCAMASIGKLGLGSISNSIGVLASRSEGERLYYHFQ